MDYENWELLIEAMSKLTRSQSLALVLTVVGFKQAEIGRAMGCSQQAVSKHLLVAKSRMRGCKTSPGMAL